LRQAAYGSYWGRTAVAAGREDALAAYRFRVRYNEASAVKAGTAIETLPLYLDSDWAI